MGVEKLLLCCKHTVPLVCSFVVSYFRYCYFSSYEKKGTLTDSSDEYSSSVWTVKCRAVFPIIRTSTKSLQCDLANLYMQDSKNISCFHETDYTFLDAMLRTKMENDVKFDYNFSIRHLCCHFTRLFVSRKY